MNDPTEQTRRSLQVAINTQAADRAALQARYGQVWDTSELAGEFEVLEFAAPFVLVKCKADRKLGSLLFQHHPRYYFAFEEDHADTEPH
jgi:hypothetical protein